MDAITWNTGWSWSKYHLLTDDGRTRCGADIPWLKGQWKVDTMTATRWMDACSTCKEHLLRETGLTDAA